MFMGCTFRTSILVHTIFKEPHPHLQPILVHRYVKNEGISLNLPPCPLDLIHKPVRVCTDACKLQCH